MAGEISGVTPKMPNTIDQTADLAKGLGLSGKAAETVKEVVSLLGGRNVSVNTTERTGNAETGRPIGATGVPALDNPADIKQIEANLEKLISYLQMDNEERQTAMAKDRIEIQKDSLDAERKSRSEKIDKALKDMDKAAESRKASKIFGWLMTALAVVAAVVACIATGGLAIGPVVGAGIAIACQVLNETGVMDKIVEKLAKGLEGLGMSKQAAQILAQVLITVAIMAASLGTGLAGGGAAAISNTIKGATQAAHAVKIAAETMDKIRTAVAIASMVVGLASTITGGVASYRNFNAGMAQADVSETEKFIAALKQRLDESEEELKQILLQLQAAVAQVAEMLSSATDTSNEIAQNLGAMA
ncbi:MAG: type III secretion system translocon subunit SctE [Kiritimatiellae bacterium]|nr:type III secretion system translocon subunit SctE [Kiritimatiellia bacterium]